MNSYEEQYYKVFEIPFRDTYLHLKASLDTGRRRYSFTKLDFGDGPIFFTNAEKGDMPFIVSDFNLHSFFPVVSKEIADKLLPLNINGFQLFPAVLIGDDEEWHEDFSSLMRMKTLTVLISSVVRYSTTPLTTVGMRS
ncbi:hypothetical protein ACVT98_04880 [Vibrio campbellii]